MADTAGEKKWTNLKIGMADLEDVLQCWTCTKVLKEPVSYRCGHFVCGHCAKEAGTKCGSCNVPSLASEIRPDRIVSAVVGCFQTLSNIINYQRESPRATGLGNTSNKLSTSIVHSSDNHINKSSVTKSKIENFNKFTEEENCASSEPRTVKEAFTKPSRLKKKTFKENQDLAAAARNANTDESQKQSSSPEDVTVVAKSTLKKNDGRSSTHSSVDLVKPDLPEKSVGSDEEFPQDNFVTPKKPRRISKKKTSAVSSNSKAKELNYSVIKSTPRKSNTPGRELAKRNYKGETPLHVACIKGNVQRVHSLLEANASPNTKDNAGWTPLHEAVNHGFTEVVELLVKAGALINVPGAGNITPLHEAVINNFVAAVKLLVAHGADVHARSSEGKTPMDLATSDEVKEALLNSKKESESKSDLGVLKSTAVEEEMVLCGESGLTNEEKMQLIDIAVTLNVRIVPAFGPDVTHLIVPSETNGSCAPSMEVLCAILKGVFILNRDWLDVHKGGNMDVQEDAFELNGITDIGDVDAPKLSRINAQKQLPGLFNGCHFFVTSNAYHKLPSCSLNRQNIITLVKTGGGIVLTRRPDPEAIPVSEQTVPYHAPRHGELTSTSHFIIYSPGKGEPEMKYNMKHCKTLTVDWFVKCVLKWQLIDP